MSKLTQNNPFTEIFRELGEEIARQAKELAVGTVRSVSAGGISISIDGDTQGAKNYTCSRSDRFRTGDRVLLGRESGTWIVICRIGSPGGPAAKTNDMTQSVGVDADGALWTVPASAYELPVASTSQLGGVKTSAAYSSGTHTVKVAADSNGVLYAEKPASEYATELSTSASSDTYNIALNSNRELVPSHYNSATNFSLGSSLKPFSSAYIGYFGTVMIGNDSSLLAKLGFFGHTANGKQTLSLTTQNMGYSSVNASNYLVALNNLIGILKEKHGLIG